MSHYLFSIVSLPADKPGRDPTVGIAGSFDFRRKNEDISSMRLAYFCQHLLGKRHSRFQDRYSDALAHLSCGWARY
ncbi:hypothetical protein SAMN06265222_1318 [Neorhodopirellula lusitana]|uniref:Uncharacterized protein n=1 Tax=Neorhodopirellula lusitana TaxID=445327 RepID=A0ABY1QW07_9BACT|nr:hypothetical protein SAMN06265222_1318 [Neorhodopirellula lusitana]